LRTRAIATWPKNARFDLLPQVDAVQPHFSFDGKGLTDRARPIDPCLHRINPMEAIALFFTAKNEHATVLENHASAMRRSM
jgi:hypothetical protein